jgi:hypothetical protein
MLAIFALNYVLLQLFLAILLDGFGDGDSLRDEIEYDELIKKDSKEVVN